MVEKRIFPLYAISDIAPGDKRAMSSDRRKFKKWKKSLKHKSRKHKKNAKVVSIKENTKVVSIKEDAENIKNIFNTVKNIILHR